MNPNELRGHLIAKRALEIAAVGNHSVLLVGIHGAGKATIASAFPHLNIKTADSCPCGHYQSVSRECTCPPRLIYGWLRRLDRNAGDFDLLVEVPPLTVREKQIPPDLSFAQSMDARIAAAREFGTTHTSTAFDPIAERVFEMATRRLTFTTGRTIQMVRVARSIANLAQSDILKGCHVAEAAQYGHIYWFDPARLAAA